MEKAESDDIAAMMHAWGRPPGSLDTVSKIVALVGVMVSVTFLAITADLYCNHLSHEKAEASTRLLFQLPTLFLLGLLTIWGKRKSGLSKPLQAVACLPLLHIALLGIATFAWIHLSHETPYIRDQIPLMEQLHIERYAFLSAALFALLLAWHSLRSPGRHQHLLRPLVSSLLLFTLLLGLWLPLASLFAEPFHPGSWGEQFFHPARTQFFGEVLVMSSSFLWVAILPPALLSIFFAGLAHSRLHGLLQSTMVKLLAPPALVFALIVSIEFRLKAGDADALAYANLLPLLLWAALMSIIAIVALSWGHWQSLRMTRKKALPAPWTQEGVIIELDDSGAAGTMIYEGWYRGLRTHAGRFLLRTKAGDLLVPAGARLITGIPTWTSRAKAGQSAALLRTGDWVRASGFVSANRDAPFRGSDIPIAGSKGIVISKEDLHHWQSVALVSWRPALLYSVVVVIVAMPGLAAYFAL